MTAITASTWEFRVSSGSGMFADIYTVGNCVARKADDTVWVIAEIDVIPPDEDNDDFDYVAHIACRPATEEEAAEFWQRMAVKKARAEELKRLKTLYPKLFASAYGETVSAMPNADPENVLMWEKDTPREYGSIRFATNQGKTLVWKISNYYDGYDLGMERESSVLQFEMTAERAQFLHDLAAYRSSEENRN